MPRNVARKLIESHLVSGKMIIGEEIGLRIDQTLTQDATGTLVMLELEAMGIERVKTERSVQYVDHNLLQTDFKNADDHLFLRSACRKFGVWYSRPGNGVSHAVHMERFGVPGKTLLGSDSHTPAAGSLGMLAIGAGGLEVALAMAGEPFYVKMPAIWGIKLSGELPDWVSAKDVILEMLRRYDVDGGINKIIEYYGPGLKSLAAMDRHVMANMGTELGATTTIFPADERVEEYLAKQGRGADYVELLADEGAAYDEYGEINLSELEPLVALPSSPGNVVPVREVAGKDISQTYIGSSANPGLRDFAIAALITNGQQVHDRVSYDINPTSRQIMENLIAMRYLQRLLRSGARLHQAGCNGCIGMGQAPASGRISLRTVPRNFPGRSGTKEDAVYLCSPETAAASALTGVLTDPRTLDMPYPQYEEPAELIINEDMLTAPPEDNSGIELELGPNIISLPEMQPLPERLEVTVLIKVGDGISTDEIMPAGSNILPLRSNIPKISQYVFWQVDESYYERALQWQETGSAVVGGDNYGQGSSREHAALAPRYLGVRVKLAKSFARIHWQNLVNFGILPLTFTDASNYEEIDQGDVIAIEGVPSQIQNGNRVEVRNKSKGSTYMMEHQMTGRQINMLLAGSLINLMRQKLQ